LDQRLHSQLNIGCPPVQFAQVLVDTLTNYGILHDKRNALEAVLENTKQYVGRERQAYCDTLIQELRILIANSDPNSQQIENINKQPMRVNDNVVVRCYSMIQFSESFYLPDCKDR
jgi:hypothetical protein